MAMCLLVKSKSFMIESSEGQSLVPEVRRITTENGWPLPGQELALGLLMPVILEHEREHRRECEQLRRHI